MQYYLYGGHMKAIKSDQNQMLFLNYKDILNYLNYTISDETQVHKLDSVTKWGIDNLNRIRRSAGLPFVTTEVSDLIRRFK